MIVYTLFTPGKKYATEEIYSAKRSIFAITLDLSQVAFILFSGM